MNDRDAIDAINTVLDLWFRGDVGAVPALSQIARISGQNKIQHQEPSRLVEAERVRASIRLLYPDEMTPTAKRILERVLEEGRC